MEKEVKAKYDEGSVEPVSQDSKTPVVVKPVSDPSQHGNLSVLPTPTTVMMSPSPSSPSPYASTAERESIRETVSPDIEFVAETTQHQYTLRFARKPRKITVAEYQLIEAGQHALQLTDKEEV